MTDRELLCRLSSAPEEALAALSARYSPLAAAVKQAAYDSGVARI